MATLADTAKSKYLFKKKSYVKTVLKIRNRKRCAIFLLILVMANVPLLAQSLLSINGKEVMVKMESVSGIKMGTTGHVFIHQVVSDQLTWVAIATIKVISIDGKKCTAVILNRNSQFKLLPGQRVIFPRESLFVRAKKNPRVETETNPVDGRIEEGKDTFFYLVKGNEYQAKGDYSKARLYFKRILKDFPGDSMVRKELNRAEQGIREERAKAEAKQMRKRLLQNADDLEGNGDRAAAVGNTDLALKKYEQILKFAKNDPWILEKKADVLVEAGRKKEAKAVLKKILKFHPENRNIRSKLENLIHDPGERKIVHLPRHNSLKLVFIPAGSFLMGSLDTEKGHRCDEGPRHRVTLSSGFWMGKYEVTQGQWQSIMNNNPSLVRVKRPFLKRMHLTNVPHVSEKELPVERVSWNEVQEFIRKLNKKTGLKFRLPTEAEWEYACRAGSTTAFYFGDNQENLSQYGWYNDNTTAETHPIGRKKENAWGLCDMTGNVWEWCQDWYSRDYYCYSATTDPAGPSSGSGRVFRGGSWFSSEERCRSAFRYGYSPDLKYGNLGFRLVLETTK